MRIETINSYLDKTLKEHGDLVEKYQGLLEQSSDQYEDFWLMMQFGNELTEKLSDETQDWYEFWTDCNAMLPMPASVHKQFVTQLFQFKHINWLAEVPVSIGPFDQLGEDLNKSKTITCFIKPILDGEGGF